MANKKAQTFSERFKSLKGDQSYQALTDQLNKRGLKVTQQAVHKWASGGGISPENLESLAHYFGISPAVLAFGEDTATPGQITGEGQLVGWAWSVIPERFRAQMRRDLFTLALAYAPRELREGEAGFYARLRAAMDELENTNQT